MKNILRVSQVASSYEPKVGFEQGLRITFDWYRDSRAKAAAKEKEAAAKEAAAKEAAKEPAARAEK